MKKFGFAVLAVLIILSQFGCDWGNAFGNWNVAALDVTQALQIVKVIP